jgi:hypothetical protein
MYQLIRYCFVVAIDVMATASLAQSQSTKASKADEMFIKEAME